MDQTTASTAEIALAYMKRSQLQVAAASLAVLQAARLRFGDPGHDILAWVEDAMVDSFRAIDCEPSSIAAGLRGEP